MKVEKKEWQSCIELRIHFKRGLWYKLCAKHLKDLDKNKFGWTKDLIFSNGGCDVPWCKEKRAHEVYPTKRSTVSFFKMRGEGK